MPNELAQEVNAMRCFFVADGGEMQMLYEVTLCLSAISLSINLSVLLVTSAQYFFAVSGTKLEPIVK